MDPEVRGALTAVVLCANDPVAAWGGVELLRGKFRLEPAAVTGPATDNRVGTEIIEQRNEHAGGQRAHPRSGIGRPRTRAYRSRGAAFPETAS